MKYLLVLTLCLMTQTLASPVINIVVNAGGGGGGGGDSSEEESRESEGDGGKGGRGEKGGGGQDLSVSPREPNSLMIAHSGDYGALSYKDEMGRMRGFHLDLIDEVCKFAGLNCSRILEQSKRCINEDGYAGEGLMGRWYDACIGWDKTQARIPFFKFSEPVLTDAPSYIYARTDSLFENDDDVTRFNSLGFVSKLAYSPECVNREYGILDESQIKLYDTKAELTQAVLDGDVEAGFMNSAIGDVVEGLKRISSGKTCSIHGPSLMSRKDSPFTAVWNKAFREYKESGQFAELCQLAQSKHVSEERQMPDCAL